MACDTPDVLIAIHAVGKGNGRRVNSVGEPASRRAEVAQTALAILNRFSHAAGVGSRDPCAGPRTAGEGRSPGLKLPMSLDARGARPEQGTTSGRDEDKCGSRQGMGGEIDWETFGRDQKRGSTNSFHSSAPANSQPTCWAKPAPTRTETCLQQQAVGSV
ncbi:hypothetical protein CPLU01_03894 [Colletotrichum plurivorum]|uniref:Uncharacterized protein n=1 Tax=Colletotrichum plurivorum TaxID=2175906 RepID=A0A8H6NKQ8_9PEZI|nr:hypothetical protein CPLU01_03894 [Colletotrichum plurivorum]